MEIKPKRGFEKNLYRYSIGNGNISNAMPATKLSFEKKYIAPTINAIKNMLTDTTRAAYFILKLSLDGLILIFENN
jgi:hypothetical protein